MAKQENFSAEEWTALRLAPTLVSAGMSAAEPSGLFSSIKEASAGMQAMLEAVKSGGSLELMAALAADRSIPGMPDPKSLLGEGDRAQQMANFKQAVLERVRAAGALAGQKASPEEAMAYRQMIAGVAERTATASKEGGFLGFGGTRVSSAEQSFLAEVRSALGLPPA
jgi:hypothetical protein